MFAIVFGEIMITPEANTIFECSWEVCNKVGGIYTVIESKAKHMLKYYDEYYAIGPYSSYKAENEFKEEDPPLVWKDIFYELSSETGIICHYGTWLIEGEPKVILLEFDSIKYKINFLKKYYWDNFKIDSLYSSWEFEEPMLWSYATGLLIDKYQKKTSKKKIIGHFHEWLSGFGLLYLKHNSLVNTVFTTHATMLGRTLASKGIDIYSNLKNIDAYNEAKKYGIIDKFTIEQASAQNADCFTTVSEITAKEAEHFLGKKPDVLTINGFNADEYPTIEETSLMHIRARKELREYITYHFFPYYPIELKHNLIFSVYGRPETKNKGIDIFIKALAKLNEYLKNNNPNERSITVFFWPLQNNNGPKMELMQSKDYFKQIKEHIEQHSENIIEDILYDILYERPIKVDTSINEKFISKIRKKNFLLKRKGNPPVCSYNIGYEQDNDIIRLLLENRLNNSQDNYVKVIFYPTDLNSDNILLNMDLYDAIAGCHLTVLPSYYEPWGYTPLESIAVGVPTITTDLAGFGRYIKDKQDKKEKTKGVFILERYQKNDSEATEKLFQLLKHFSSFKHYERVQEKIKAKQLSFTADWNLLIENYLKAHNFAIRNNSK